MRVYGDPSPQAGTKSVPAGRTATGKQIYRKITEGGVNLKPWRDSVSAAADEARAQVDGVMDGALMLTVLFRFPMPKSRPKWMREQGAVAHTVTPDADKLVRAVGDALKVGGLIADDARLCLLHVGKVEVWERWTGAIIEVATIDPRIVDVFRLWEDD